MKNLRFEKLELLSTTERKGRTVKFHPRLTVITGENDVGKSSIIKSIYWAFGAPVRMHPEWLKAKVKARVSFTIDGDRFSIVRDGTAFGVFDDKGALLITTRSVTSELGPFLAKLLDFGLVLPNKSGVTETPPPAYMFMPFYIDQDSGWRQSLESFDNRGQYKNPRKAVVEFHSGIRPNRYYVLQARKAAVQLEITELGRDRQVLEKAVAKLNLQPAFTGTEFTELEHRESVDRLLLELRDLRAARLKSAAELADLVDGRELVSEQMRIARLAMEELGKDYAYASKAEAEIFCPTCGTSHHNDFTHKFSILDDREACAQFLRDQDDRLVDIRKRAEQVEARLSGTDALIEKVSGTLVEKEGDLTLKEVIENASANMARGLFDAQLEDIKAEVDKRAGEIVEIDAEVKTLDDKKRRKEIEAYYAELMTGFLRTLNVQRIDLDSAIKIVRKVNDTGSDQPRAVLAYHLALMKTVFRFSSALTAPMIIDSPNQQDQDATNVAAMIALIMSSRPDNGQTILGTVGLHDQKVEDGEVIELVDELSALSSDHYPQILDTMNPLLGML
ncbi:ATP-binding protein [Aminobacter carboxidus]|uniref:AAA family ATPase n=1 Tax=Aminobacter carboxidus TaxID=376165 RepID=A0ABR9GJ53_9HYPH|nr:ATP-binding protein [Aminobacter carboxidus]MBE1203694.1 AAA family ATPase [Aminobacter carboxidus]